MSKPAEAEALDDNPSSRIIDVLSQATSSCQNMHEWPSPTATKLCADCASSFSSFFSACHQEENNKLPLVS